MKKRRHVGELENVSRDWLEAADICTASFALI